MAHFAQLIDNEIIQVINVANEDCGGGDFPESEPIGQEFIASLGLAGTWLQTSYSGNFRSVYAGIGYTFDASLGEYGEFLPPVEQ